MAILIGQKLIPRSWADTKIISARSVFLFRRTGELGDFPPPAKIKFKPPAGEIGHLYYERDWSGDLRYAKPQIPETTFTDIIQSLKYKHREQRPFLVLMALNLVIASFFAISALFKIEVWVDRSWRVSPFDWERTKDNYWKWWTNVFDLDFEKGPTHQRLLILEDLQNAMLEAAKKRGTRPIQDVK